MCNVSQTQQKRLCWFGTDLTLSGKQVCILQNSEEDVQHLDVSSVSAAGASALQQLVEDARLFQRSEAGYVLCDNRDILAVIHLVFIFVAVRKCTQEGVVLIGGEEIPEERLRSEFTEIKLLFLF